MNSLPVSLCLAVEQGVFVLGQHLSLGRHLLLPPLQRLQGLSLFSQGSIDGRNDGIDGSQSAPLSDLLELGHPPRDLPIRSGSPSAPATLPRQGAPNSYLP